MEEGVQKNITYLTYANWDVREGVRVMDVLVGHHVGRRVGEDLFWNRVVTGSFIAPRRDRDHARHEHAHDELLMTII